ncbi:hypothetical protein C0Q70_02583 [Pomacea canaliculata]|uniref:Uncharacterized protein n=2 Tax=Pomacea canaliculata TaxID=400727 RepID=A0A2T7PQF0_POMCA|nr:hypothetical protein C0Q70_02583 [Pomacea canaliculata]
MIGFKNNMATSEGFEKQVKKLEKALFDQEGQELYRQIVMKHAWLRHKDDDNSLRNTVLDDESLTTIFGAVSSEPSWSNRLPPSMMQPKPSVSPTVTPSDSAAKDTEQMRREALERRLQEEMMKRQEKTKKKKKLAF